MAQTSCQLSWGLAAALLLLLGCLYPSAAAPSRSQEGRRLLQTQSRVVVTKLSSGSHCDLAVLSLLVSSLCWLLIIK